MVHKQILDESYAHQNLSTVVWLNGSNSIREVQLVIIGVRGLLAKFWKGY
jgi:hypothetical protein